MFCIARYLQCPSLFHSRLLDYFHFVFWVIFAGRCCFASLAVCSTHRSFTHACWIVSICILAYLHKTVLFCLARCLQCPSLFPTRLLDYFSLSVLGCLAPIAMISLMSLQTIAVLSLMSLETIAVVSLMGLETIAVVSEAFLLRMAQFEMSFQGMRFQVRVK